MAMTPYAGGAGHKASVLLRVSLPCQCPFQIASLLCQSDIMPQLVNAFLQLQRLSAVQVGRAAQILDHQRLVANEFEQPPNLNTIIYY